MSKAEESHASDGESAAGGHSQPLDPYRELFEHSADAILIIEGDKFVDCNESTVRMLRYRNKDELLRTHPSELSPPEQPDGRDSYEKANEMIAIAFEKGSHRFEWDHRRADGEVFPVEVLLTAIREPRRRTLHVVWRDITDRKRLEAELLHSQKMDAIGKLAGGIAHDFNNLLVAIVGNADILRETLEDRPEALRLVDEMQRAADRGAGLVRQLLTFSRKQEVVKRVIDVVDLIQSIRGLVERLVGESIRLEMDLGSEPLPVLAGEGQIEQAVLNLASNARDAMPAGGVLTIAVRSENHANPIRTESRSLPPGRYATVRVTDTGTGMTPHVLERAFDPFFTTKSVDKGTGLGLATVYGIAQQHGGSIALESEPGRGTTVTMYFPTSDAKVEPPRSADAESPVERGTETILVVEDEEAVASLMRTALRRQGYTVISANNGKVALSEYEKRADDIDLVITDVIMPELGGAELTAALLQAGHSPRFLYISGYTDDALSRLQLLDGNVDLLMKPFSTSQLLGRVRRALDH